MTNSIQPIICRVLFVLAFVWTQQFSFSQSNCSSASGNIFGSPFVEERGRCLATSRENDAVYVAGNIGDSTLLLKVDLTGKLIWSRVIDAIPAENEVPSGIVADADGMIAIVGTGRDQIMGGILYAFRYNPDTHTILWSHEYSHSPNDYALGMIEKGNGGNYLLTNQPTYWAQSMQFAEVVEMDKTTGMMLTSFSKNYRDHETETLADIAFYENYVYGIGRYKNGGSVGTFRNTLVKLDGNSGNQLWVRMGHVPASGTARLYGSDLAIADNSIFSICSGDPSGTSTSARKLFIQRTAVNGNLNWIKQYELPGANDISHDLIQSGNGLIAFAYEQVTGRNFLFKIDFEGNVLWAKTFEFPSLSTNTEELRSNTVLVQAGDRLVFTGFGINATGDGDVLVVQTDLDGNVQSPCVESQSISLTAQTVNNPAWYEQSPEQFNVEFQTSDNSPESEASLIPISQECAVTDTLFSTIEASICEGESYEGYTQSGTYTDHFTTASGCDSIRTLTLTVESCAPQCPETFAKVLGSTSGDERGYAIAASETEHVVYVAGTINDSLMIVRVLETGDIDWARKIELFGDENVYINGMILDAEGKLGIAGTIGNLDDQGNMFVCRYDPAMNQLLWSKELFSTSMGFTSAIYEMGPGGNYLISNNPSSPNNAELFLLDKNNGALQPSFAKHYNLGGPETIAEVELYNGGLYSVGRYTDGATFPDMRTSLMRMDPSNGVPDYTILGHKSASTTARIYGVDLVIDKDFIYYISLGDPDGTSIDNTEIYVQKANLDGSIVWLKQYDLPGNNDWCDEIIKSGDGFVVLARNRVSPSDIFLFKIDVDGNVVWSSKFDYSINDNSVSLGGISSQMVTLGDFIYFTAYAEKDGQFDMILAKVSQDGLITDSCMTFTPFNIEATEITNRTYYNVDMDVFDFVPQAVTHANNIGIDIPLEMTNLCGGQSGVESNVEASICEGEEYEGYTMTGIYIDVFQTSSGCDSTRTLMLTVNPLVVETVEKEICNGQAYEGYTHSGTYQDTFELATGCDSIRILNLIVFDCDPIVTYNLNDCRSNMTDGSNMDYSEFIPAYPNAISCGNLSATTLHRNPPQENKHSCTPGVNSSIGMCISSITTCTYIAGHSSSLVAELSIQPEADSIIRITKFEFYERSPDMYNWIGGGSGPNNYPKFYGIRVLKNGTEIYRQENISTHLNWTLQSYDFSSVPEFDIDASAVLRFELLPYCAVGNGAPVSAWDIDEVNIFGGCVVPGNGFSTISGTIKNSKGIPVSLVNVSIAKDDLFNTSQQTQTDLNGIYSFNSVEQGDPYFIRGQKNDDLLKGVNTFDLLTIQKHLLGIQPLTTLPQFVAADINHSNGVNVLDLLELKKALLGITNAFSNNTSWRIGNCREVTSHDMIDFSETELIPTVTDQQVNFDLLGIKIGDVNEDFKGGLQGNALTSRGDQNYVIELDEQVVSNGTEIIVPIRANSDIQLEGLQLMFEGTDFELTGIQKGIIPITAEDYHIDQHGALRISWSQAEPILISEDDILFTLTLYVHSSGKLSDKLQLQNDLLPEVYTQESIKPVSLSLTHNTDDVLNQQMSNITIEPNPFKASTTIRFEMMESGPVRFVFFDLNGRKLYEVQQDYLLGPQSFEISNGLLPEGEALIYCQIVADEQVSTQKLVKMR